MNKAFIPRQACSDWHLFGETLQLIKGLVVVLWITIIISSSSISEFLDVVKTKEEKS